MAGTCKRHSSVSIRLPLLLISSFLIIIAFVVALVYKRFEKRTIQEYTDMAESATMMMTPLP